MLLLLLASNIASYGCLTTVRTTVIGPQQSQQSQVAIPCLELVQDKQHVLDIHYMCWIK